jgi:hypothetical protein
MDILYLADEDEKRFIAAIHRYLPDSYEYEIVHKVDEFLNLQDRRGIVIVGGWRGIFLNDPNNYLKFVNVVKEKKIPLAVIIEKDQELPQNNNGIKVIERERGRRSLWDLVKKLGKHLKIRVKATDISTKKL